VNRAYGGVLSGSAVRERFVLEFNFVFALCLCNQRQILMVVLVCYRIIRAFLVEEQKIVKKVLKLQKAKEKVAPK